jgi:uncharacterized protein (DUF2267 family)
LAFGGVDELELADTLRAFEEAGVNVTLLAASSGPLRTVRDEVRLGATYRPDDMVHRDSAAGYDALVLPGGVLEPDRFELGSTATRFVYEFTLSGKPVGVLSEGPWSQAVVDALCDPEEAATAPARMLVLDRKPLEQDPARELPEFCAHMARVLSALPASGSEAERPGGLGADREFVRQVSKRCGLPESAEVERVVRAVFAVLGEHLDVQSAEELAARLPSGLRHVMLSVASTSSASASFSTSRQPHV